MCCPLKRALRRIAFQKNGATKDLQGRRTKVQLGEFCTFCRQVAEYRFGQRRTRLPVSFLLAYYGKDD